MAHTPAITFVHGRNHERWLHTKHRIAFQIAITSDEQMRHESPVVGRGNHEMYVRRPERVPSESAKELTDRSVGGNRIADGSDRSQAVTSSLVGPERATQVARGLIDILHVVQAIDRRLPDLNLRARERKALFARDHTLQCQHFARLFPS